MSQESSKESYPEPYLRGIELFNRGEFFNCHDAWEELWLEVGPPRANFLKGLIQASVALYHLDAGNLKGAMKLYEGQKIYLSPYRPKMMGLEIDPFLNGMDKAFAEALSGKPNVKLDQTLAPQIRLL